MNMYAKGGAAKQDRLARILGTGPKAAAKAVSMHETAMHPGKRKTFAAGGVVEGTDDLGEVDGVGPLERLDRKGKRKGKGKSDITIVINAGQKDNGPPPVPALPPAMPMAPPPSMPPAGMGGNPPMKLPPMGGGMPPMGGGAMPPGAPPMPRAAGGRAGGGGILSTILPIAGGIVGGIYGGPGGAMLGSKVGGMIGGAVEGGGKSDQPVPSAPVDPTMGKPTQSLGSATFGDKADEVYGRMSGGRIGRKTGGRTVGIESPTDGGKSDTKNPMGGDTTRGLEPDVGTSNDLKKGASLGGDRTGRKRGGRAPGGGVDGWKSTLPEVKKEKDDNFFMSLDPAHTIIGDIIGEDTADQIDPLGKMWQGLFKKGGKVCRKRGGRASGGDVEVDWSATEKKAREKDPAAADALIKEVIVPKDEDKPFSVARKHGGKVKMTAGAETGKGRLQKTENAKAMK